MINSQIAESLINFSSYHTLTADKNLRRYLYRWPSWRPIAPKLFEAISIIWILPPRCINIIFFPYMTTLSVLLVDKKWRGGKRGRGQKQMNSAIAHLSSTCRLLLTIYSAYGSLSDAGDWWILWLVVGVFELGGYSSLASWFVHWQCISGVRFHKDAQSTICNALISHYLTFYSQALGFTAIALILSGSREGKLLY